MSKPASLDIVIPVYNEEKVLPLLLEELDRVFAPSTQDELLISHVRCIFVDDGSNDSTMEILARHTPKHFSIHLVRLSRNFGHQPAISAGISYADADMVAVMDSDMQDPPHIVTDMIAKLNEGHDVVYAQRIKRNESAIKKLGYALFYKAYSLLSPIKVAENSGDFCVMRSNVVKELNALPESLRFVRGLRSWVGFKQTAIGFERPPRAAGEAKYTFRALYKLATDGIASLSIAPLKLAQMFAVLFFILGISMASMLFFLQFGMESDTFWLFVSLVVIVLGLSLNMFFLYILGAYVGRAYLEIKGRPPFIVAEKIKLSDPEKIDG